MPISDVVFEMHIFDSGPNAKQTLKSGFEMIEHIEKENKR